MNLLQISSLIFICAIFARCSASDAEIEELKKQLPETLTLTLPVSADQKITLNLKKSQKDAVDDDILIIVSDHDSENIWKPRNKEVMASYSDDKGSTVEIAYVKEDGKKGITKLYYGTFTHGKEVFVLRPESESPNAKDAYKVILDGISYCVFHHIDGVNFGSGDEIKTKRSVSMEAPVLKKRNFGISRSKRPSPTDIVIDIFGVIDNSIYQSWMAFNNNDKQKAILNIKYYFANVINSVSKKYESIKKSKYGYKYSAKLISLFIATTPQDSSFIENSEVKIGQKTMNINKALEKFTKWIQEKDQQGKIPKFDVATAFTKYEAGSVAGLAWVGKACELMATAVVSDKGVSSTAETAAHEIGHNMGANHDGENGNNCRYEDQYLMAWKNDPDSGVNNLHTFSPCSINYFDDTVQRLDGVMKDNNCLKVYTKDNTEFAEHLKTLPGQKFSVDQQCQFVFGPQSYYCSHGEESDEEVCEQMFCKNLDEGQCKGGKMYRAYDGTPCGNKKWCMGGKCVSDNNAPAGKAKCVHGDNTEDINYNNAPLKCPDLKRQRGVCSNNPNMAKYCCKTCEEILKEGPQGCREGDMNMYSNCDDLFSKNVFMCEQKQNQDGCCQSCYPFMREVNKCLQSGKPDAKYCGNRVRCERGNCVYNDNNLFTKGGHADRFSNCDDLVRRQKSACKDQLKEDCPLSCFRYGGYQ